MTLVGQYWLSVSKQGLIHTNVSGAYGVYQPTHPLYKTLKQLKKVFRSKYYTDEQKQSALAFVREKFLELAQNDQDSVESTQENLSEEKQNTLAEENRKITLRNGLQNLMNFFSEFSFSPNFRFTNTLVRKLINGKKSAVKSYIACYFALTDNIYQAQINDKMKCQEFDDILNDLSVSNCAKQINNRFKLYYGAQGTGKTTQAMLEAGNNCMVCHSAMLPSDLMEDFSFEDGKAAFKPSALCKAMIEGKQIVLDEINLLPFESLRFLQSILDGKSSFVYKGQAINIVDGFKIIGTMNLQVNGQVYPLPEPLVDRAEDLKEYKLTAEQLMGAID